MKRTGKIITASLLISIAAHAQSQGDDRPKPPGAEERLKHVTERFDKELKLSAAQKTKLTAAYKTFFIEMEKLPRKEGKPMPPPPPPPPADKAAVDKLVKARDAQVKASLTAEQFKKYEELEKTMRPPGPGQRPLGPPPGERKE